MANSAIRPVSRPSESSFAQSLRAAPRGLRKTGSLNVEVIVVLTNCNSADECYYARRSHKDQGSFNGASASTNTERPGVRRQLSHSGWAYDSSEQTIDVFSRVLPAYVTDIVHRLASKYCRASFRPSRVRICEYLNHARAEAMSSSPSIPC